jgi:hypothetical protein
MDEPTNRSLREQLVIVPSTVETGGNNLGQLGNTHIFKRFCIEEMHHTLVNLGMIHYND